MPPERILVLYNEPVLPTDHPDAVAEHEVLEVVESVYRILREAGYRAARLGLQHDPNVLLNQLRKHRPAAIFNLFEGTADHGHTEAYVAGLLQWLDVPFTGSPFHTLALCRAKHLTKHLLRGAGLPTPDFLVVDERPIPRCNLDWPVIVKPATQDASVGVNQGSVVTTQEQLDDRVHCLLDTYGPPVLVERYIRGREFNVAIVEDPGLRALPPAEIAFAKKERPGQYWPIVTYDGKWKPGSIEDQLTPPRYPADVTPELRQRVVDIAIKAYRLLDCRDYARVDLRVRPSGRPFILEVNPNPDISTTAGFAGCLRSVHIRQADFVVQMVRNALARRKEHHPSVASHPPGKLGAAKP
jgi:D-alanine-D-alanine ligase